MVDGKYLFLKIRENLFFCDIGKPFVCDVDFFFFFFLRCGKTSLLVLRMPLCLCVVNVLVLFFGVVILVGGWVAARHFPGGLFTGEARWQCRWLDVSCG